MKTRLKKQVIETIIFPYFFYFFIIYNKKYPYDTNSHYKKLIGTSGLLISIYIAIKMFYMNSYTNCFNLSSGFYEYVEATRVTILHLFKTNSIISVFAVMVSAFLIFYKKQFNKKEMPFIIASIFLLLLVLKIKTHYLPIPGSEVQNYSFVFWFIYPCILIIFLIDYFRKDTNKYFISNLITVSCICGIIGCIWQINSCFKFNNYIKYLKTLINTEEETFIKIPEKDFKKYKFSDYNTCFCVMHKTSFLSDEYEIKKLLIPAEYYTDYDQEICRGFNTNGNSYYDKNSDIIYLQSIHVPVKTKYWDLTVIRNKFEGTNLIGNDN